MSKSINIPDDMPFESVNILNLKAGDTLVVKVLSGYADVYSVETLKYLESEIKNKIPEGVNLLMVTGVSFEIIRPEANQD